MSNTLRDITGHGARMKQGVPMFGIEIEVENCYVPDDLNEYGWNIIGDGSLRNNGMEFVSKGPRTLAQVEADVLAFYEWSEQHNYTRSIRTSTHVHVNALDLDCHAIAAAAVVHALVEPLLFRYCGPVREENIYCVPWYRAPDEIDLIPYLLNNRVSRMANACKYSSLYLEPLRRFGTLEFRHAPVFETAGALLEWIDMCAAIVYAGWESPDEVLGAYRTLGPDKFVDIVFGMDLAKVLRSASEMPVEDLLDDYDVLTTLELAFACTYKPTTWFRPKIHVEATHDERLTNEGIRFSESDLHDLLTGRMRMTLPDVAELPEYLMDTQEVEEEMMNEWMDNEE